MKKIISILCMTLVLSLSVLFPVAASAVEIMPAASTIISSTGLSIAAKSGGKISVTASIVCYSSCDKVGFPSIKIQEQTSSGTWSTVKSTSSQYAYNAKANSYTFTYDGTVGKKYRAVATFTAVSGTTTDDRSITSETKTATN